MDIGRIVMRTPGERVQLPRRATRSGSSRLISFLESVLFVVGMVCLGYYAYVAIEARLYQELENRELDMILSTEPTVPQSPGRVRPPQPLPGSAIGRIEIPRLGVSAIIRAASARVARGPQHTGAAVMTSRAFMVVCFLLTARNAPFAGRKSNHHASREGRENEGPRVGARPFLRGTEAGLGGEPPCAGETEQ